MLLVNSHPLNHLQKKAVLLVKQIVEQMLLFDFLVSEVVSGLFQLLYSLERFLCEFADVHSHTSFMRCESMFNPM